MGVHATPYGTWIVRWSEPDGYQASRSFKTEDDAEEFYAAVKRVVATGQPVAGIRPEALLDGSRLNIHALGHYVYLLRDAAGAPIYVGCSANILGRLGDHMERKDRRARIATVSLIRCRSAEEMRRLETALIHLHKPELNVRGLLGRPRRKNSRGMEAALASLEASSHAV